MHGAVAKAAHSHDADPAQHLVVNIKRPCFAAALPVTHVVLAPPTQAVAFNEEDYAPNDVKQHLYCSLVRR